MLENIRVMDQTAITVCQENDIPIIVFSLFIPGNIMKALMGDPVGTSVDQQEEVDNNSKKLEMGSVQAHL